MGDMINNTMSSAVGIKQYYVNGTNGSSVVRVAFDPHSTATSRTSSGSGVIINIGTKNLSSNAAINNAVNRAVSNVTPQNADDFIKEATENIMNSPEQAIKAASMSVPNEEVVGLLL